MDLISSPNSRIRSSACLLFSSLFLIISSYFLIFRFLKSRSKLFTIASVLYPRLPLRTPLFSIYSLYFSIYFHGLSTRCFNFFRVIPFISSKSSVAALPSNPYTAVIYALTSGLSLFAFSIASFDSSIICNCDSTSSFFSSRLFARLSNC